MQRIVVIKYSGPEKLLPRTLQLFTIAYSVSITLVSIMNESFYNLYTKHVQSHVATMIQQ